MSAQGCQHTAAAHPGSVRHFPYGEKCLTLLQLLAVGGVLLLSPLAALADQHNRASRKELHIDSDNTPPQHRLWNVGEQDKLARRAQRIEGGQAAGFCSSQQAGADIGADEDRLLSARVQQASENDHVVGGKTVLKDQGFRCEDMSTLNINDPEPVAQQVEHELSTRRIDGITSELVLSQEFLQRGDQLGNRETADQQEVVGVLEASHDGLRSSFAMVAFDQCAGVKEVQHGRSPLITGPSDLLSEAAAEHRQFSMKGLEGQRTFRQPFLVDIGSAWRNRQASLLKILERDAAFDADLRHGDYLLIRSLA